MPIRVLCLHGHGSTSKVMEVQTAALRRELGDDYEWVFANGTTPVPMAPELEGFYPASDTYFGYFSLDEPESLAKALIDLEDFIFAEGPFDIIMCVCVASSVVGNLLQKLGVDQRMPFKGAIFFSGQAPLDTVKCAKGELGFQRYTDGNSLISIPTANIWGRCGDPLPDNMKLAAFCSADLNVNVLHEGNTSIPGASNEKDLVAAAQAIRQTVEKAVSIEVS